MPFSRVLPHTEVVGKQPHDGKRLHREVKENEMKTNIVSVAKRAVMLSAALATFIFSAQSMKAQKGADRCYPGPLVKNMMPLRTPTCQVPAPHELTKRDIKKLAATAKSPEDHLKIAAFYTTHADNLENQAAANEEAAAEDRRNGGAKNMMSPTMPGHLEYLAKTYRKEAKSDRDQAAAQRQLATNAVASAN